MDRHDINSIGSLLKSLRDEESAAGYELRENSMGMFDYVRSEISLPDGFTGELQSKDFDCAMTDIVIGSDGRLRIEDFEYESVPKEERPHPNAPDGSLKSLMGCMRRVNRRWRDLNYHGDFNFYGFENGGGSKWHEYSARFTDGQLVSISDISEPSPDNQPSEVGR